MRIKSLALAGPLLVALSSTKANPPRYVASWLPFEEDVGGYWSVPMDGDETPDFVVSVSSRERSRELWIYLQRADGSLPARPDRRVVVKRDIVAFSFADLREEPGTELLLFTRSSCYSLSTRKPGYAGNVEKLFAWPFVCDVPQQQILPRLPSVFDLDGDAVPEVLTPGIDGYGLFARKAKGTERAYQLVARFRVKPSLQSRGDPRRRVVFGKLGNASEEPFGDLVSRDGGASGGNALLEQHRWLPAPALADADGDGRLDLFYLEGRELKVFPQARDGRFPESPAWHGSLGGGGPVRLADLDGDRRVDLIASETKSAGEEVIRLFKNRGGGFQTDEPDQVMKFEGYGVEAQAIDIDGDRTPEFVVSSYHISAAGAVVSGGKVDRRLLVYRRDSRWLFDRRPVSFYEETFTPKEIKGIGQRINLDGDLKGKGGRDALLVNRDGALEARSLAEGLQVSAEPFWRFAPRKLVLEFKVLDLNRDGRSDLVLKHSRALTVLVSSP